LHAALFRDFLYTILLAISKQTRDELALSNALNLLFGKGLLTRAAFSIRSLEDDLFKPFGALDRHALRLVSPFPLMKIDVRLNGIVFEHSKKCGGFKR
jgi:hypothetical protein